MASQVSQGTALRSDLRVKTTVNSNKAPAQQRTGTATLTTDSFVQGSPTASQAGSSIQAPAGVKPAAAKGPSILSSISVVAAAVGITGLTAAGGYFLGTMAIGAVGGPVGIGFAVGIGAGVLATILAAGVIYWGVGKYKQSKALKAAAKQATEQPVAPPSYELPALEQPAAPQKVKKTLRQRLGLSHAATQKQPAPMDATTADEAAKEAATKAEATVPGGTKTDAAASVPAATTADAAAASVPAATRADAAAPAPTATVPEATPTAGPSAPIPRSPSAQSSDVASEAGSMPAPERTESSFTKEFGHTDLEGYEG